MASQWLKTSVIEAGKPQHSIISLLKKNIGGYQPARSHKVVHASSVTKKDFCPRKYALLDIYDKKQKDEWIGTAMQATFDIGNLTAKQMVEQWGGQYVIGNWKCRTCNAVKKMGTKPGHGCSKQMNCHWEYEEPNFVSAEYDISGSLDVLFDLGSQKWIITELKIMKVEDFEALKVPLPEHRIRTGLYLKIVEESDSPYKKQINLHEARVLYVSRGYGKKNEVHGDILPFKEFTVKRDDLVLEEPLKRAKQVKVFRDTVKEKGMEYAILNAVPSGICKTAMETTAKHCSVCTECFSGAVPAKQGALL